MTGVEILRSETIYNTFLPDWCGVLGVSLLVIGCVVSVVLAASDYNIAAITVIICSLVLTLVLCPLSLISNETNINYIEYKVIIDDSVSMNEFLDKYEILDQEGKIYTVKERE